MAPVRPYQRHRFGGTHRGYWDYEGGGLSDMGQHYLDGFNYAFAKDLHQPGRDQAYAPPAHPEAWHVGLVRDEVRRRLDAGPRRQRMGAEATTARRARGVGDRHDLSPEDREKLKKLPDPPPLVSFPDGDQHPQAGRRPRRGGPPHLPRCMHLTNIAIRTGRKLQYDPVKEEIIGDEEANRLVYQPMRAPWRI